MSEIQTISKCFSEGKIDASGARQRMLPLLERRDAALDESYGAAPQEKLAVIRARWPAGSPQ